MGLPNINIEFKTTAASAIERSEKGVVGVIIKDANANGEHVITKATQIPGTLGAENKKYIERAFMGYINPPKKVIVYVLPSTEENLDGGLDYFSAKTIDYLVGPPDISSAECTSVVSWIKAQRLAGFTPKAVLPNTDADSDAIINFTSSNIKVDGTIYTAAQYCSRIAGLIAGTPMTVSCTYAPLSEVSGVAALTKEEMDEAIDTGEFILFFDGEKIKVGRGVNSFQTTTEDKGDDYKKIKIVEAIDMINSDIRRTAQDSYIGKYSNSYDNKCLLISAIKGYLTGLESGGILEKGTSYVGIDVSAQENFLIAQGIDTSGMTELEIKKADTRDKSFIAISISILDAIEDIDIAITI